MTDDDICELMALIGQLKVMLLPDDDCDGGLSELSRKQAWLMARDAGRILLRAKVEFRP